MKGASNLDSIIERLILADEQSRNVLDSAKHNKDIADVTLKENKKRITEEYRSKADKELKQYRISEKKSALSEEKSIEANFEKAMRDLENSEKANFDRWVSNITENIFSALSDD